MKLHFKADWVRKWIGKDWRSFTGWTGGQPTVIGPPLPLPPFESCDWADKEPRGCCLCDAKVLHRFENDILVAQCAKCGTIQAWGLHININARIARLKDRITQLEVERDTK